MTTAEKRGRIGALRARGWSYARIAKALGITKSTVAYHCRRLGAPVDDRASRRYDWAAIQEAYDSGLSVRECAQLFGFCLASWQAAVRRGAVIARPRKLPIEQLLVLGRPETNRVHLKNRLIAEGLKGDRCERCGITEWLAAPLSLELHHRNGDPRDNRIQNLSILCPNCHSQTDTWGGRNGHRSRNSGAATAGPV